jgi:hypothetical protein
VNHIYAVIIIMVGMFIGGVLEYKLIARPTWQEILDVMPLELRRDIAIDYCVANREFCKNLPMKSPFGPMDGNL